MCIIVLWEMLSWLVRLCDEGSCELFVMWFLVIVCLICLISCLVSDFCCVLLSKMRSCIDVLCCRRYLDMLM